MSSSSSIPTSIAKALQLLDAETVIEECERIEQSSAMDGKSHPHALEHMTGLLLANDMHEARFLYMRLDEDAKKQCEPAWNLILMLRSGDMIDMSVVRSLKWPRERMSPELNDAIDEVIRRIYSRAIEVIPRAYDVVSRDNLAQMLGLGSNGGNEECDKDGDLKLNNRTPSLESICTHFGWKPCNDDSNYIVVTPINDDPSSIDSGSGNNTSTIDMHVATYMHAINNGEAHQVTTRQEVQQQESIPLTQLQTLTEQLVRLQTT